MGQNMGAAFFEEEQAVLEQTLTRLETAGIPLVCIPDRQENLVWREQVYGDIDCFVSIGGQSMAMGAHEEGYALGQGVLRRQRVKNGESFLLGHYLNLDVPVTVLLNVRTLCAEYGLPFDPITLAPIGENALYYKKPVLRFRCCWHWALEQVCCCCTGDGSYGRAETKNKILFPAFGLCAADTGAVDAPAAERRQHGGVYLHVQGIFPG